MANYYITPTHNIALNCKVATNAIATAIMKKFYPDQLQNIGPIEPFTCRQMVELTEKPDKPILLLVRDPVERFLSACAMLHRHPQEVLMELFLGGDIAADPHFFPQAGYIVKGKTTIFNYHTQMEEFCAEAGLDYPLESIHVGLNPKHSIEDKFADRIRDHYADDQAALESTWPSTEKKSKKKKST